MTFASEAGALAMTFTARPIIRWLGFKPVLLGNTVITALTFMSYSLFTARRGAVLIIATLLVGGFFRSLQYTALNAIALRGSHGFAAPDVSSAFIVIGVLSLAGLVFFVALAKDAGAEVSGKPAAIDPRD